MRVCIPILFSLSLDILLVAINKDRKQFNMIELGFFSFFFEHKQKQFLQKCADFLDLLHTDLKRMRMGQTCASVCRSQVCKIICIVHKVNIVSVTEHHEDNKPNN